MSTGPQPGASRVTGDLEALHAKLGELGLRADVHADGALAVLVPRDAGTLAALQSPERRTMVLEAARTLGFTHAAVELTEQSSGSGSGSSTESGASSTEVRLFVAVLLPGKVRAGIAGEVVPSLRERLPRAAWVRPDNLHVTLKFAGRRPEALVPELTDALRAAAAGVEPFDLVLEGVGAFPSLERPRVLWLGARDQGAAHASVLARRVDAACAQFDVPKESRAFRAHVTLARVRDARERPVDGPTPSDLSLVSRRLTSSWTVPVGEIALMRSDLERTGSRYTVLARCALGEPRHG